MKSIFEYFPHFPKDFTEELAQFGSIQEIPSNAEILREGQFIKQIPIVLEGSIKVFTRHEEKELLLYYMEAGESCIMSFQAGLKNLPSKVFAITEENSVLLLLPIDKMKNWLKSFPVLNDFFYNLYDQRYASLLDTIHHLLYNRLDQRLYNYLLEKSKQKNSRLLKIRHKQIAAELGTVREVVSRVIKKLENEGKLRQIQSGIEIQ